jgi:hypothetical protein
LDASAGGFPTDSDLVVAAAEVEAKAKNKNKAAYAHLANCLTASQDLRYVCCGKTDAWPNGLAMIIIKCMFGRYKPDDAMAMAEFQSKVMKLQLRLNDNPSDLFLDIADIKAQYELANYTIDQPTVVSTVLHALPQQYNTSQ